MPDLPDGFPEWVNWVLFDEIFDEMFALYGSAFITSNSANYSQFGELKRESTEGYMACTLDPLTFVV